MSITKMHSAPFFSRKKIGGMTSGCLLFGRCTGNGYNITSRLQSKHTTRTVTLPVEEKRMHNVKPKSEKNFRGLLL